MKKKEEEEQEDEEEEAPKKKKTKWTAEEVPTQTEPMVVNNEEGKAYPQAAVNAMILNKLEAIEKAVLG